jgi:hypothetical protein
MAKLVRDMDTTHVVSIGSERGRTKVLRSQPIIAVVVSMCLASCNLTESHDCPDYNRYPNIDLPNDYMSSVNKVDDCLAEYGTKLARGNSSDHDAATAAVSYCGLYQFNGGFSPDELKADRDKEMNVALRIIVSVRAFHCPAPRTRDLDKDLDGNPVPTKPYRQSPGWGEPTNAPN